MPKKLIQRLIPNLHEIRQHQSISFLGRLLHDPNLWHLNRRSVSGALALGLFIAWIPFPSQMLLSAILSIFIRVNLPIAVIVVWISNPITMPPMFYFAYILGAKILGLPVLGFEFELSISWLLEILKEVWLPFLMGCVVMGLISSLLGFFAVRIYWRWHVIQVLKKRQLNRKQKSNDQSD